MKKQRKQRDVNCEGTWPRTKTRTKKTGENFLTSYNRKTYVYVGTCSDAVHSSVDVNIFDVTIRSKKCFSGTAGPRSQFKKKCYNAKPAHCSYLTHISIHSFQSSRPPLSNQYYRSYLRSHHRINTKNAPQWSWSALSVLASSASRASMGRSPSSFSDRTPLLHPDQLQVQQRTLTRKCQASQLLRLPLPTCSVTT